MVSPRPVGDRTPEQFTAELATLQQAMGRFQAAFPDRAEGWDEAHVVQVAWSTTAGPEVVTVARDWERKVTAGALGTAVLQAHTAAMVARGEAADRTLRGDEVWADIEAGRPTRATPPVPTPRPGEEAVTDGVTLAEQVLATVARVETEPDAGTRAGVGAAAGGAVAVEIGDDGLRRCDVDARWAAGKSGLVVVGALQQAFAAAHAEVGRAAVTTTALGELDGLLGQITSMLRGLGDSPPAGDTRGGTR